MKIYVEMISIERNFRAKQKVIAPFWAGDLLFFVTRYGINNFFYGYNISDPYTGLKLSHGSNVTEARREACRKIKANPDFAQQIHRIRQKYFDQHHGYLNPRAEKMERGFLRRRNGKKGIQQRRVILRWHSPQERPQSRCDVLADLGSKRGLVIGHAESSGDRWWVLLNQTKDPEIAVSAAEIKRWCYVKECIR